MPLPRLPHPAPPRRRLAQAAADDRSPLMIDGLLALLAWTIAGITSIIDRGV